MTGNIPIPSFQKSWRIPLFLQVAMIVVMVLLLQIPVLMIWELVSERDKSRQEAVAEIADKWGRAQSVVGPFLSVPYVYRTTDSDEQGRPVTREREDVATFLPRELQIHAQVDGEVRYRGIFEAPVYRSNIRLTGVFDKPDFSEWGVASEDIRWERAELAFEIADVRAIQAGAKVSWRSAETEIEPGAGIRRSGAAGIHAAIGGWKHDNPPPTFAAEIILNGSSEIRFAPMGRMTEVQIRSNWSDPSFQGASLPVERSIGPEGFEAKWSIPHLGRNYPQSWKGASPTEAIAASRFGVDLLTPVDAYRQTGRSLKYQILFLGLTFVTIWLFEVLASVRVHWIQYLLIGAAMCLFYLLELSLAEQLGFGTAYAIASGAVVALVASYARAALASRGLSAVLGGVVVGLYGCLYILLRLQDYALLAGSIGLFVALAAIMYATRNVDWYAWRGRAESPKESA